MNPAVKRIENNGKVYAIILRSDFSEEGIHFFTPNSFSQQLGYMKHPAGHIIKPHLHVLKERKIEYTQEVLFIRKGKVRVDLYDDEHHPYCSEVLKTGDVLFLAYGGHGFEILEPTEMIEIKQGPFLGEEDKVRFDPDPAKT